MFGDESVNLKAPVGYRGEHTLSMRSTKASESALSCAELQCRRIRVRQWIQLMSVQLYEDHAPYLCSSLVLEQAVLSMCPHC